MISLLVLVPILIFPTFIVSDDFNGEIPDPNDLIIWSATDPKEDVEAAKINASAFYIGLSRLRSEYLIYYNSSDVNGAIKFLKDNLETILFAVSCIGNIKINWTDVFTRINAKKVLGQGEHGLSSLIDWAIRETGPETKFPTIRSHDLITFLLINKTRYYLRFAPIIT